MKKLDKMFNSTINKLKNNKKLNKEENEIVKTIVEIIIYSIDDFENKSLDEKKKLISDKSEYINSLSENECSKYINKITYNYFNQFKN